MNNDFRISLLGNVAQFRKLDLVDLFAKRFPDQADLTAISFGSYTAASFITLCNQFMDSLEAVLGKPQWHVLSAHVPQHNEYGPVDASNMLANLLQHIAGSNLDAASQNLDRLIYYAMTSGFWLEGDQRKQPTKADLKGRSEELEAQAKRLDKALEQYKALSEELNRSRAGLEEFRNTKVAELDEVRRNMESSRTTIEELQRLLQNGQSTEGNLKAIQEGLKEALDKANIELATLSKAYEAFKADSDLQRKGAAEQAQDTEEHLKEADELRKWIESRKERIEQLTGMAADGYLGNKYNDRSKRLEPNINLWRWAILVAVVVTVAWVVIVFQWVHTRMDNPWVELGVNILKTIPAFILLGFVLRQYGKERDLQEEYAFKSAVAMTINAYADLLNDKDDEKNRSRQKLILNALKQVHTPPQLSLDKSGPLVSFSSKDVKEAMVNLTEALKSKAE